MGMPGGTSCWIQMRGFALDEVSKSACVIRSCPASLDNIGFIAQGFDQLFHERALFFILPRNRVV